MSTDACRFVLPEALGLLMVLEPAFSTVDVVASPSTPFHEGRYEKICQMESASTKRRDPNTYLGSYGLRKLGWTSGVVITQPILFSFGIVFDIGIRIVRVMMSENVCFVTTARIIRRRCVPLFVEQKQTCFVIKLLTPSQLPFPFIFIIDSASRLINYHIQPGHLERHWMPMGGPLRWW